MLQQVTIEPAAWSATAAKFRHRMCPDLLCYADEFLNWDEEGAYTVLEDASIKSKCRAFLDRAVYHKPLPLPKAANDNQKKEREFETVPFLPQTKDVTELVNALRDNSHIGRDDLSPPCWLPGHDLDDPPSAKECISTPGGILHLPSGELYEPTPKFFTFNALTFEYGPEAPEPSLWLQILNQYWPPVVDDVPADEVLLLQEMMGYLLTPDTSLHKMFCFHGEPRGGKGTVVKTIRQLLGEGNIAASSLTALGKGHTQELIGKTGLIIPEAVFGRFDDRATITALLKAISGEDKVQIERKYLSSWSGVLMARIVLMANKIPSFADDSKAFADRIVPLKFNVSFKDREDSTLADKLTAELPGILNWSIEGWKRLKQQGWRFTETATGRETRETIERAASSAVSFVDDCCVLDAGAFITEDDLYGAFKLWCMRNGIARADNKSEFMASLEAARSQVKRHREKGGKRRRGLRGIRLADDAEVPPREEQVEVPF